MSYEVFYRFDCGIECYDFNVTLDDYGDAIASSDPAPWTALEFNQCDGCAWNKTDRCPVALRLQEPAKLLDKLNSYERAQVTVTTQERTYSKECSIQEGLSSLFGLVMARSGCPAFEPLRGLAWFHLPFATFEETMFRVSSTYLLRHYLQHGETLQTKELIENIQAMYEKVYHVNRCIITRMREGAAPMCDSPYNAIVLLDSIGNIVSMSVEEGMEEIRHHFL